MPLETYEALSMYWPNQWAIRYVADWLHHDALISGHQDDDLVDFDRLLEDLSRPASLPDALLMTYAASVRDRTYGELEIKGLLSEKARIRWRAHELDFLARYAEGFQGERILWIGLAADRVSGSLQHCWSAHDIAGFPLALIEWIFGCHKCAIAADAADQYALRLHHLAGRAPLLANILATKSTPTGIIGHYYPNVVMMALTVDASHRMSRVAISILQLLNAGGTLPSTQAQLLNQLEVARDLDAGGDHFRIEYERLADDRFRITLDPSSPVPDFIEAKEYAKKTAYARSQVESSPFVWTTNRIEIRVSGHQH